MHPIYNKSFNRAESKVETQYGDGNRSNFIKIPIWNINYVRHRKFMLIGTLHGIRFAYKSQGRDTFAWLFKITITKSILI